MAAQEAKITESPDVSRRMEGSGRMRWGKEMTDYVT